MNVSSQIHQRPTSTADNYTPRRFDFCKADAVVNDKCHWQAADQAEPRHSRSHPHLDPHTQRGTRTHTIYYAYHSTFVKEAESVRLCPIVMHAFFPSNNTNLHSGSNAASGKALLPLPLPKSTIVMGVFKAGSSTAGFVLLE